MKAPRYNIGDWRPEQYNPIKQSPFDAGKSKLLSYLEEESSKLKPQGDVSNLDPRYQQYMETSNMLAKAKQKFDNMPWNPSMKRTLGATEGVSLLQESEGDMDRYEEIIRSDYEAARNQFGETDPRTKNLRNKLDQIAQFKFYKNEEPAWKNIINPPTRYKPPPKLTIDEMLKHGTGTR
jgi:hypothetical protein